MKSLFALVRFIVSGPCVVYSHGGKGAKGYAGKTSIYYHEHDWWEGALRLKG